MHFSGPTWRKPGGESVLIASRRYDGSTSRKTKGSMADTLQCNLWRRAQTPHRMTHCVHGGVNHGQRNGFTALGKTIGTHKSSDRDSEYVEEHSVLKYLRGKLACYLHDKCIFVCQSTTLSKQCANLHQTMYKPLSYMFKHTPNCIKTLQTFYKLCANQQNCI